MVAHNRGVCRDHDCKSVAPLFFSFLPMVAHDLFGADTKVINQMVKTANRRILLPIIKTMTQPLDRTGYLQVQIYCVFLKSPRGRSGHYL